MQFITNFGNSVVVLPIAAAMLLWLAWIVGRRTAMMWFWALLLAGGGTALLKIYFDTCGTPTDSLESPSGHASMSTLVYGGLALVLGAETESWQRVAIGTGGALFVAIIALSRVTTGAHSSLEVAVGLFVGCGALYLFARRYLADRRVGRQVWPLVAAAALIAIALHGHPAEIEPFWHALAAYFRDWTGICAA